MVDPIDISHIIEVVPYDPRWPKAFEEEAKHLHGILGNNVVTIYHIGSTAVPGLAAKPIIDILIVVKDILDVDKETHQFEQLGYTARGELGIPFRRHFHKGDFLRTHNVHIFEEGAAQVDNHIHFRDYLRNSPQISQEYAELKFELAKKHPKNMLAYLEGKEGFVRKILTLAPHQSLHLIVALTSFEWEAVRELRKQKPFVKDGYTHMLLLLGILPIGYAEIFHGAVTTSTLKEGYEEYHDRFHQLLTRWLDHQRLFKIKLDLLQ